MSDLLPPPLRSSREVAEYLGVSIGVVYRLIRAGRLKAIKVGGQYRITPGALRKLAPRRLFRMI
jgi:excisionase family DNA binding protein